MPPILREKWNPFEKAYKRRSRKQERRTMKHRQTHAYKKKKNINQNAIPTDWTAMNPTFTRNPLTTSIAVKSIYGRVNQVSIR